MWESLNDRIVPSATPLPAPAAGVANVSPPGGSNPVAHTVKCPPSIHDDLIEEIKEHIADIDQEIADLTFEAKEMGVLIGFLEGWMNQPGHSESDLQRMSNEYKCASESIDGNMMVIGFLKQEKADLEKELEAEQQLPIIS